MTIQEIFQLATANDVISELKSCRFIPQPDVESANKALDPKLHDIMSPILRPDKRVQVSADNEADSAQKVISTDGESTNFKTVRVARVAVALQKLIIKRAVSFVFGNSPAYNSTPENEQEEAVARALDRILYGVKCKSLNRKIGRSISGIRKPPNIGIRLKAQTRNMAFHRNSRCVVQSFRPPMVIRFTHISMKRATWWRFHVPLPEPVMVLSRTILKRSRTPNIGCG